jgi:hypothetical protein
VLQSLRKLSTSPGGKVSIAAERTQWDVVFDLLSDGDWHAEKELAEITRYPKYWLRELGESGYLLERSADGRVRLLTAGLDH